MLRLWPRLKPTLHYWAETETHVYALSIAANVLLSFFPFMVVLTSLVRFALHWFSVEQAIYLALGDYFAGETGEFIVRNLKAAVWTNGKALSWVSMLLLLFTANGVFMPLEVAFNKIWGIHKNRSFVKNQIISQGLIFGCGVLWLGASLAASPMVKQGFLVVILYKIVSLPITMLIIFLTYWLLPNAKIPALLVLVASFFVAVAIEAMKLLNLLIWPWLWAKLKHEYGLAFAHSVTIVLWSFAFGMLVLAGAEWSARKARELGLEIAPRE